MSVGFLLSIFLFILLLFAVSFEDPVVCLSLMGTFSRATLDALIWLGSYRFLCKFIDLIGTY